MKRYSILFLFLIAILSCNKVDNPKIQFLKWAQKGTITDNVKCKSDPSQSYCIYLPSNYDVGKTYPVIYSFDPHGKGCIPVALMKNTAEKLDYILVGSNNSKNGLRQDEINSIVSSLFSDTQEKLSIDPNRIYLSGFSGGARIACMIAQGVTGIKGVIACSAGFQPNRNPLGYRFIGIAGTQDMNYLEMRHLNSFMDSVGIQNQFIVFKGKHQWPNESTISEAVKMLDLYAMQNSLMPINKSTIDEYLNFNQNRIQYLKNTDSPDSIALAYSTAQRTYQVLNGLVNVESLKTTIDELSQKPAFQKYSKEQASIESYETQKQKEFVSSFGSKPESWWNEEIKRLNNGGTSLKGDVSKRLLGYISLSCYGYVNGALHYQDWKAAEYFTSIYKQVDPENPDSWYALACLQANTGKLKDAIESLRGAIKFGFSDFSKIQNDPLLQTLHGLSEFDRIAKK